MKLCYYYNTHLDCTVNKVVYAKHFFLLLLQFPVVYENDSATFCEFVPYPADIMYT